MRKCPYHKAFTLIEISLVLGILVGLTAMSVFGLTYFTSLARAHRAEAILRLVENARLSYLIDNPTDSYMNVTGQKISQYLPGGWEDAQDVLKVNGYEIVESDLTHPSVNYGILPSNSGISWALPIKGFECARGCRPPEN